MRVLVDMDGVLADFEKEFFKRWQERHPEKRSVQDNRTKFYISDEYDEPERSLAFTIMHEVGFFAAFEPIPGALDALRAMRGLGWQLFICTSPLVQNENCASEKYQWVVKHLGFDWLDRLILTSDKTVVRGDILIDDKPKIYGADNPTWEHVIYEQPYNREVAGKRRMTWENWREVLIEQG